VTILILNLGLLIFEEENADFWPISVNKLPFIMLFISDSDFKFSVFLIIFILSGVQWLINFSTLFGLIFS